MRQVKELPGHVRLWVPARRATELETLRRGIIAAVGGVTTTHSWGYWKDDNGNTVGEPVVILEAFYAQQDHEALGDVLEPGIEALLAAGEAEVLLEAQPIRGPLERMIYAA